MKTIKRKFLGIVFKLNQLILVHRKVPQIKGSKTILIAANMGLGNMLFFTPVIKNLKIEFPDAKFILLKGQDQQIDQLFESDFNDILSIKLDDPSFLSILTTIRKLRRMRIDVAFCNFISSTFYLNFILSTAKTYTIIGHGTSPTYFNSYDLIYDISVPVNPSEHEIERNLNLLKNAGLPAAEEKMFLNINQSALLEVKKLIDQHGLSKRSPLIGIAPGSYANGWWKRWDRKNYVELIKKITKRYANSAFILLGGKDDLEVSNLIVGELKQYNVLSLANKTSVKQLIALISCCDLLIGNDTGPVHIASALDKPAICIWGPSYIQRAYLRHKKGINIWKNLPCSPCYTDSGTKKVLECNDRICLSTISVDEVFAAVKQSMS